MLGKNTCKSKGSCPAVLRSREAIEVQRPEKKQKREREREKTWNQSEL